MPVDFVCEHPFTYFGRCESWLVQCLKLCRSKMKSFLIDHLLPPCSAQCRMLYNDQNIQGCHLGSVAETFCHCAAEIMFPCSIKQIYMALWYNNAWYPLFSINCSLHCSFWWETTNLIYSSCHVEPILCHSESIELQVHLELHINLSS